MSRDQVSQYALTTSIDEGGFEDVKFFAFSRRTRAGTVDTPLPIVANTKIICNTSSHFNFGAPIPLGLACAPITDQCASRKRRPTARRLRVASFESTTMSNRPSFDTTLSVKRGGLRFITFFLLHWGA